MDEDEYCEICEWLDSIEPSLDDVIWRAEDA